MIKDIIEKIKAFKPYETLNKSGLEFLFKILNECIFDLEKSVLQEEALIKALVEMIKKVYMFCNDYCVRDDCNCCEFIDQIKLLESITGKKWEEIKEKYR